MRMLEVRGVIGMLLSITGPSGVGKGYTKEQMLKVIPGLEELTWMTTRPLRSSESGNKSNRRHIKREDFEKLLAEGRMLFCQELYGNLYGILSDELCHGGTGLKITEFHIDNVVLARKSGIEFIGIAIVPESTDLLSKRLQTRGTEEETERQERLLMAEDEIDAIMRNTHLFDLLITVNEENQGQIAHETITQVIALLERRA